MLKRGHPKLLWLGCQASLSCDQFHLLTRISFAPERPASDHSECALGSPSEDSSWIAVQRRFLLEAYGFDFLLPSRWVRTSSRIRSGTPPHASRRGASQNRIIRCDGAISGCPAPRHQGGRKEKAKTETENLLSPAKRIASPSAADDRGLLEKTNRSPSREHFGVRRPVAVFRYLVLH
jgi:hypothetical protein